MPVISKFWTTNISLKRDEYTSKFDPKSDEGTFLGFSTKSKAFKCFNKRTNKIVERVNVKINEYSDKYDDTKKYDAVDDEQKLVIIEPEIQNDVG